MSQAVSAEPVQSDGERIMDFQVEMAALKAMVLAQGKVRREPPGPHGGRRAASDVLDAWLSHAMIRVCACVRAGAGRG